MRSHPAPNPWRQACFALGLRLPPENREWVRHQLTTPGWRIRLLPHHLYLVLPVCAALALLPGEPGLRIAVIGMFLAGSTFTVAVSASELRARRLDQHGLTDSGGPVRPLDS